MFATHRGSMSTSRLPTIVGQTGVPLGLAHGLGGRHGSAELGNRPRGRAQRIVNETKTLMLVFAQDPQARKKGSSGWML